MLKLKHRFDVSKRVSSRKGNKAEEKKRPYEWKLLVAEGANRRRRKRLAPYLNPRAVEPRYFPMEIARVIFPRKRSNLSPAEPPPPSPRSALAHENCKSYHSAGTIKVIFPLNVARRLFRVEHARRRLSPARGNARIYRGEFAREQRAEGCERAFPRSSSGSRHEGRRVDRTIVRSRARNHGSM